MWSHSRQPARHQEPGEVVRCGVVHRLNYYAYFSLFLVCPYDSTSEMSLV